MQDFARFFALLAASLVGLTSAQTSCLGAASCSACRTLGGCGWCVDTTVAASEINWKAGSCESGTNKGPSSPSSKCFSSSTNGWNYYACCSALTGSCKGCIEGGEGACGHCVMGDIGYEPCLEKDWSQHRRSFSSSYSENGDCRLSGSAAFYDTRDEECGASHTDRNTAAVLGTIAVLLCCCCIVCLPCIAVACFLTCGYGGRCCSHWRANGTGELDNGGDRDRWWQREVQATRGRNGGSSSHSGTALTLDAEVELEMARLHARSRLSSARLPAATIVVESRHLEPTAVPMAMVVSGQGLGRVVNTGGRLPASSTPHPVARWGGGDDSVAGVPTLMAVAMATTGRGGDGAGGGNDGALPTATVVIAASPSTSDANVPTTIAVRLD